MSKDWRVTHVVNGEKLNVDEIKKKYPNEINEMHLKVVKAIAKIKGFKIELE